MNISSRSIDCYSTDYLANYYDSNHKSYAERLNDIPDELAQRLARFQSQFSDLFANPIATRLLGQSTIEQSTPTSTFSSTSSKSEPMLHFRLGFKISVDNNYTHSGSI